VSTDLQTLIQNIAKELGYASGTCSAEGTTTTVIDASTDSPLDPDDDAALYDNAWLMIESDSAETPLNVGAVRRVTTYAPSTGTLTLSRALADATTVTQSYGIYQGAPPFRVGTRKGLAEYVGDVLGALRYREYSLLTLVTDGAFDASTTLSNWAMSGLGAAQQSTEHRTSGQYSLRVTAAADGEYVESQNARVQPGEPYVLHLDYWCAGAVRVVLCDATNSADLADTGELAGSGRARLWATVPDDCEEVTVRVYTPNAVAAYLDTASLRHATKARAALPAAIVADRRGIESVCTLDEYGHPHDLHGWGLVQLDAATLDVEWRPPSAEQPVFVRWLSPYAALSALTDTTDADPELVKAWALVGVYADLKRPDEQSRWWTTAMALHRSQPRWSGPAWGVVR
jgi:hypothetical protein